MTTYKFFEINCFQMRLEVLKSVLPDNHWIYVGWKKDIYALTRRTKLLITVVMKKPLLSNYINVNLNHPPSFLDLFMDRFLLRGHELVLRTINIIVGHCELIPNQQQLSKSLIF